jgi:spore germination protein YaaH
VSFADARRIAADSRTSLARDAATYTLRAARKPEWDMWVSDAALVHRLVRAARRTGVSRFALWRLGQEDPALWEALGRP